MEVVVLDTPQLRRCNIAGNVARKILVVEDSAMMHRVFEMAFRGTDYELRIASTADEALTLARRAPPDFVLADLTLPTKNGYDLCAALKSDAALSNVRVLLLGGATQSVDEAKARVAGADGHFQKPFETQALFDRLQQLGEHKRRTPQPEAATAAWVPRPTSQVAIPTPAPTSAPSDFVIEIDAEPAGPYERAEPPVFSPKAPVSHPPAVPPAAPPRPTTAPRPTTGTMPVVRPTPPPVTRPATNPLGVPAVSRSGEYETVLRMSRETIERVAWEVVPELAETIIRKELDRLLAARVRGEK